jgi:hypothetical protein
MESGGGPRLGRRRSRHRNAALSAKKLRQGWRRSEPIEHAQIDTDTGRTIVANHSLRAGRRACDADKDRQDKQGWPEQRAEAPSGSTMPWRRSDKSHESVVHPSSAGSDEAYSKGEVAATLTL